ncbi:hypothetical protein BDP27DRAFT_1364605 [Rhodocollybia butyracea]|uniref:Uncharacterized protein n=1 Tax=Rhodocollybia butyracea TaxID=206335 RepID=A0A9P5U6A7_9AGAR|nr:hypothetical protein BDP27DRAFT_1364605 [Rhodocollybia butyracea]
MGSTPFGPPTFVTEPAGFFLRPSQSLPPEKISFRNSPVFSTPRKSMYRESVQLLKDSDDEGRLDSDGSNDEGKLDLDGSDDKRKLNADSVGGLCDADTQTTVDEGEKDMFNDERSKGEKENALQKGSQSHTSLLDKEGNPHKRCNATTAVGSFISMLLICSIVGAIVGSLSRILM